MNIQLRGQLAASIEMHNDPAAFVGKVLHDLSECIECLDKLRTDPATVGLVERDWDSIGVASDKLADIYAAVYPPDFL